MEHKITQASNWKKLTNFSEIPTPFYEFNRTQLAFLREITKIERKKNLRDASPSPPLFSFYLDKIIVSITQISHPIIETPLFHTQLSHTRNNYNN